MKASQPKNSTFSPLHERNEHSHRIVILNPDGTNDPSQWYPLADVAFHERAVLWASSWPPGVFPPGIFKIKEVAHQTLEGSGK